MSITAVVATGRNRHALGRDRRVVAAFRRRAAQRVLTVVAVLLAALSVTVNCPSSGPVSEPSPLTDLATLTLALSLSVIVPVAVLPAVVHRDLRVAR